MPEPNGMVLYPASKGPQTLTLQTIPIVKLLELAAETTPQATLQAYVATAYGMLDPDSKLFSPMFATSLCISTLRISTL
jgi:hypothetical protein